MSRPLRVQYPNAWYHVELADYKWSSYSAYIKTAKTPSWLTTEVISNYISTSASLSHVKDYQGYVEKHDMNEINNFFSTKLTAPIIGSEAFKKKILSQIDILAETESTADIKRVSKSPSTDVIIKHICSFYNIDLKTLLCSSATTLSRQLIQYLF